MEELVKKIVETSFKFETDAKACVEGNKTAGRRARKASLELEKLLKQFRKDSL